MSKNYRRDFRDWAAGRGFRLGMDCRESLFRRVRKLLDAKPSDPQTAVLV